MADKFKSDENAFSRILKRLQDDAGNLFILVEKFNTCNWQQPLHPFWAFARMLFPIVESIGDLIYGEKKTLKNLIKVLENEFESVKKGYKGKGEIITTLFRHSLIHQDELRILIRTNRLK